MRELLSFHRIIIVDMTHGGKILAEELKKKWEVVGIDVYDTMDPEEVAQFKLNGIQIIKSLNEISLKNSDTIIAPVHCNPQFLSKAIEKKKKIISFHKIVGNLLRSELKDKFIIEITGTHGKSTTTITLAKLLSYQYKVLCLSSRGLELFQNGSSEYLKKEIEIAPPYLLHVKKYLQEFDIGIFEISLGGIGLADIGVLTNIIEDYPIANSTKNASHGKKQLIEFAKKNSVIFYNSDDKNSKKLINDIKTEATLISFGETGQIRGNIIDLVNFNKHNNLEIVYDFFFKDNKKGKINSSISGKVIGPGYFYATLTYVGVALILKINKNKIIENLYDFNGIQNRLNLSKMNDCWILNDINSGVGDISLEAALKSISSYLTTNNCKIWLIFDANTLVCEGIDIDKIQRIISKWKNIIADVYSTNLNMGKSFLDLNKLINDLCEKARKNDIIFITKKVKG
ncbi:MAG: coenzyme F430 synthase [Candidatus Helarchaeota archaeon]|nr:coenzyme F430 synthase [Candidatus Helarchaeota archaeon]